MSQRKQKLAQVYPREIDDDTPISPEIIANAVLMDAWWCVSEELPKEYVVRLSQKARELYRHDPKFRRQMRARGNAGRDGLYKFTRQWLSAILEKERPAEFQRLPKGFRLGHAPPKTGPYATIRNARWEVLREASKVKE